MTAKDLNNQELSLNLLRESIWGIEDKLKVVIESFVDQESEIRRLLTQQEALSKKVNRLELNKPEQHDDKRK